MSPRSMRLTRSLDWCHLSGLRWMYSPFLTKSTTSGSMFGHHNLMGCYWLPVGSCRVSYSTHSRFPYPKNWVICTYQSVVFRPPKTPTQVLGTPSVSFGVWYFSDGISMGHDSNSFPLLHLKMFEIVLNCHDLGRRYQWHRVGSSQGCCQTPQDAQDSPLPLPRIIQPQKFSSAKLENSCVETFWISETCNSV